MLVCVGDSCLDMFLCARTYLARPACSTASEKEFKVGKGIQTQTRARLLPTNLEIRVFLYYNLRALKYATNLENPPAGFVAPSSIKYDEQKEDIEQEIELDLSKKRQIVWRDGWK